MKQYIDLKQWDSLSQQAKEKLFEWSKNCKSYQEEILEGDYDPYVVILSIGQMIEFLANQDSFNVSFMENNIGIKDVILTAKGEFVHINMLCDVLWEAVKEVLEK